ncbi:5'-3' exoribonuclease 1, partial [Reticulomyxa filosa]
ICKDYLTGIQWVLDYYYRGVPSWGWYYPHHYAPLISDMALMDEQFQCQFSLGEPYLPFEQLLAVLPIASSHVLPAPFQALMTNPESLISNMYPTDFKIDMDYATSPWEGVVLLPYIDERKLKEAVATIDSNLLTEEEKVRNKHGCTHMYRYDPEKAKAKIKTRIKGPQSFGSIVDVVSISVFIEPHIQTNQGIFLPRPYDVKYLEQNQIENKLEKLDDDENYKELEKIAWNFMTQNETCFVDWPYLREAQVVGAGTLGRQFWYNAHKNAIDTKELSSQQYDLFRNEAAQLRQDYLNIHGLDVGVVRVIVYVRPLYAMSRPRLRSNAQSKKQVLSFKVWHQDKVSVPLQIIVNARDKNLILDNRFELKPINDESQLQLNKEVMYIGSLQEFFGTIGYVIKEPTKGLVDIRVTKRFELVNFGHSVIQSRKRKALKYYSFDETVSLVDITPNTLSRICGVIIAKHNDEEFEIGLRIKLNSQQLIIPEYVRIVSSSSFSHGRDSSERYQVEFSQKCVDLLIRYKQQFPLIFELLNTIKGYKLLSEQFATTKTLEDVSEKDNEELGMDEEKSGSGLYSQDNGGADEQNEDSQEQKQKPRHKEKTHGKNTKLIPPSGNHPKKESKKTKARREDIEMASDSDSDDSLSKNIIPYSTSPSLSSNDKGRENRKRLRQIQKAEGFQYLVSVVQWLKQQEIAQLPLIEMDAVVLEKDTILAIQKEADQYC